MVSPQRGRSPLNQVQALQDLYTFSIMELILKIFVVDDFLKLEIVMSPLSHIYHSSDLKQTFGAVSGQLKILPK